MKKYIVWLLILGAIEISLALWLTVWREHFWQTVSLKQSLQFMQQLGIFTIVAFACCVVSGLGGYLVNLTTIRWREKLNTKAFAIRKSRIENMSQRIQDDCWKFPELVLTLGYGFCKAVFYILVFSISLVYTFDWWYLGVLVSYTIIGSVCTSYIAKPLIKLNYEQQRAEATYRGDLSISNFQDCVALMLGIAKRTKRLTYFQQFYMQIAVVIPLIIIAPVYFQTAMTLGLLMRFNSLAGTILDNLGYGISSWGNINLLLSCRRRLKEINII